MNYRPIPNICLQPVLTCAIKLLYPYCHIRSTPPPSINLKLKLQGSFFLKAPRFSFHTLITSRLYAFIGENQNYRGSCNQHHTNGQDQTFTNSHTPNILYYKHPVPLYSYSPSPTPPACSVSQTLTHQSYIYSSPFLTHFHSQQQREQSSRTQKNAEH